MILGGPNGAGKTTAASAVVPVGLDIEEFVNADEIARRLSPSDVEGVAIAAGRQMLARMQGLVRQGRSFAFETTCAGMSYVRWLRMCQGDGWRLSLIYLWLPTAEMALSRVARRVRRGGHDIPPDVVRRRYAAGLRNMRHV